MRINQHLQADKSCRYTRVFKQKKKKEKKNSREAALPLEMAGVGGGSS